MKLPRLSYVLVLAAVGIASAHSQGNKKSKIVSTVLNTKWSNTPLVLEASEALAEENNEFFWDFLDYLSDKQNIDLKRLSAQEIYENIVSFASRYSILRQLKICREMNHIAELYMVVSCCTRQSFYLFDTGADQANLTL